MFLDSCSKPLAQRQGAQAMAEQPAADKAATSIEHTLPTSTVKPSPKLSNPAFRMMGAYLDYPDEAAKMLTSSRNAKLSDSSSFAQLAHLPVYHWLFHYRTSV